jgi:hypothetical protein
MVDLTQDCTAFRYPHTDCAHDVGLPSHCFPVDAPSTSDNLLPRNRCALPHYRWAAVQGIDASTWPPSPCQPRPFIHQAMDPSALASRIPLVPSTAVADIQGPGTNTPSVLQVLAVSSVSVRRPHASSALDVHKDSCISGVWHVCLPDWPMLLATGVSACSAPVQLWCRRPLSKCPPPRERPGGVRGSGLNECGLPAVQPARLANDNCCLPCLPPAAARGRRP